LELSSAVLNVALPFRCAQILSLSDFDLHASTAHLDWAWQFGESFLKFVSGQLESKIRVRKLISCYSVRPLNRRRLGRAHFSEPI
jgi:hypothetical protein